MGQMQRTALSQKQNVFIETLKVSLEVPEQTSFTVGNKMSGHVGIYIQQPVIIFRAKDKSPASVKCDRRLYTKQSAEGGGGYTAKSL